MQKIYFEKINSTQIYAKAKAKAGIKNEIYIAKVQTNGIGRNGHEWTSISGGLWFSFITDSYNKFYSITVGVAIIKTLKELYNIDVKVKWPNDILLNRKKIAGIICEKINNLVVVGIGINTNFEENELKELSNIATTIKTSTKLKIDNEILLDKIMENVMQLSDKEVISLFRANMEFLNEKRYVSQIKKEAVVEGIDDTGRLIVSNDLGEYKIDSGTI